MGITIVKIFHLGKYILGYTFGNQVFGTHVAKNLICGRISDDIPPQMKILNTFIPQFIRCLKLDKRR